MSDPVINAGQQYAYNSPGHRQYNKSFEPKAPFYDIVKAPWMSNEVTAKLPNLRLEFDLNRDPYIALQLADMKKTEAQRREEQTGNTGLKREERADTTKRKRLDQPTLELKPPRYKGAAPETPSLAPLMPDDTWMERERDRVMALVPQETASDAPEREISPSFSRTEPSR